MKSNPSTYQKVLELFSSVLLLLSNPKAMLSFAKISRSSMFSPFGGVLDDDDLVCNSRQFVD